MSIRVRFRRRFTPRKLHDGVLKLDAGHALVDAIEKRHERVVVLLLVIVAGDFVEAQLDVSDFGGDGVDSGERPAAEIGHRFGRADGLRAGGLVDRKRVVAERLLAYLGDFGFDGAATVAQDDLAPAGEAFKRVDRSGVFLAESALEFFSNCAEYARHRSALTITSCTAVARSDMGILAEGGV